ncbi:MAG: penicillin-binding protein 2 [Pseudomonadota bacterium]
MSVNYSSRKLLEVHITPSRMALVAGLLGAWFVTLGVRAAYLQGLNTDFLQGKGDAVASRRLAIPANRGMVLDRFGQPLAISTPVETLWARPSDTRSLTSHEIVRLAAILATPQDALAKKLKSPHKGVIAIDRNLSPEQAVKIAALGLPGIKLQREFRRFYPAAEVAAHVVGFTNVDDVGQEGVELAYDDWLAGKAGTRHVLRDRRGHIVQDLSPARGARMGGNLGLSLDLKLQYIAHRELSAAVAKHKAKGGGIVVLDARSGEILALSNLPVVNPNNRKNYRPDLMRNRAVIDTFEPGSTIKPFTVAAALERGLVRPDTLMHLPDDYMVGRKHITDVHYHPQLTVTEVLQKSSNIGAVKMAMQMKPEEFWDILHRAGFGEKPGSGFPGEAGGRLRDPATWKPVEQATQAYGHGLSVSLLQLARAYMAFANDGVVMPLTFLKREPQELDGERVLSVQVARQVREMMETVTHEGGTAILAQVPGYRVAGKTGTAYKLIDGRYSTDSYISSFVGLAPASDPRLIIAVMIDEPREKGHFGGQVAGPVFAQVMAASLRQLGVSPDAADEPAARLTRPLTNKPEEA